MRIHNKEIVVSKEGQVTVTGMLNLSKHTVMKNMKNNGKSPLDLNWDPREQIVVAAGDSVDYECQETNYSFVHTVSRKTIDGQWFEAVRVTPKEK